MTTPSPGSSRLLIAAALLAVLLAALLGAWFVSGWHDVRMRQAELRQAPVLSATRRKGELARELQSELEELLSREVRRPHVHYLNLMHDPSDNGLRVTPSPLAERPDDRLVLGYFQIDSSGRTSTPTINDEVPELSDQPNLGVNRAFRDQVVRDFAYQLTPAATTTPPPMRVAHPSRAPPPPAPVAIVVSPLEWKTLPFAGAPVLVAARSVQTPDGNLTQGFVIDRATLTSWLAGKAGDMVAELHAASDRSVPFVAPGWQLTVVPNPRTIASAAASTIEVARAFLVRFIVIALVAAIAAGLVLMLVLRAEKLARERG